MYQDLHAHSYYSFCGQDNPKDVVEAAYRGGLDVIGLSDHNYGIGYGRLDALNSKSAADLHTTYERMLRRYYDHIQLLKEAYRGKIRVLSGIEVCTLSGPRFPVQSLPDSEDISFFDFCLLEALDSDESLMKGDLFSYAKRCRTPLVGVAHTDMFAFLQKVGADPLSYFRKMADSGIFWEMNVNYDSTHGYRQHAYVKEFFSHPGQQEIVRKSGVLVSVGFDGHKVADYRPDILKDYCQKLEELDIPMPFSE